MNASGTGLTTSGSSSLRVVVLKPGKYDADGHVQRFRRGFMPNSSVSYLASLTPTAMDGARCETVTVGEYVHTDLDYLDLLARDPNRGLSIWRPWRGPGGSRTSSSAGLIR